MLAAQCFYSYSRLLHSAGKKPNQTKQNKILHLCRKVSIKNPCSVTMYVKVAQYCYEFPVIFLSIHHYNYFKPLIFCQPSTSKLPSTNELNHSPQSFHLWIHLLTSKFSHLCIVSGKSIAIFFSFIYLLPKLLIRLLVFHSLSLTFCDKIKCP